MLYPNQMTVRRARRGEDARTLWRDAGPTAVCEPSSRFDFALLTPTLLISSPRLVLGTHVMAYAAPFAAPSLFAAQAPVTPAVMLNDIREAFGLNMSQLAQALQCERVTVYAWLREDDLSKLREGKRQRLQTLYQIARVWRGYSPLAGRVLLEKVPALQGRSVLDLLCADSLDPSAFASAYEQLARSTAPSVRAQRHRAEQRAILHKVSDGLAEHLGDEGMDLR